MIRIDFSIDPAAQRVLTESGSSTSTAAIIAIIIEKEVLKLLAPPIPSSGGGLESDLKAVRQLLESNARSAAYLIHRTSPSTQQLVIYVNDNAGAKERMLYATGTSRVLAATPHAQKRTIQISSLPELQPSLFEAAPVKMREELMTESERNTAAIAKMEVAPQPIALPGVAVGMAPDAQKMLTDFAHNKMDAVTFRIEAEQFLLDQSLASIEGDLGKVKDLLPQAEPRFVLVRYTDPKKARVESVMVYVCPPSCSPKVKIHYASAAAAFRAEAARQGIRFAHKVETDTRDTLMEDVQSAFAPVTGMTNDGNGAAVGTANSGPRPPVSGAQKGHRMLI